MMIGTYLNILLVQTKSNNSDDFFFFFFWLLVSAPAYGESKTVKKREG